MQLILPRLDRTLLITTSALLGAAALLLSSHSAQAAFDPNADTTVNGPAASITNNRLPDPGMLSDDAPVRPLYVPGTAPVMAGSPAYISPLEPIKMPKPLYPSRAATANAPAVVMVPAVVRPESAITSASPMPPTPAVIVPVTPMVVTMTPTLPNMPPVDAATQARAQAIMAAQASPAVVTTVPVVVIPPTSTVPAQVAAGGFIAPPPVLAPMPSQPALVAAKPVMVSAAPAVVMAAPAVIVPATPIAVVAGVPVATPTLSAESRAVLGKMPSRIDSPVAQKASKVTLSRVTPQINDVLGQGMKEDKYQSVGLSISVRRPGLDTNTELNNAYTALMGGDTTRAIETYKNILSVDPKNEDALFGLAATYHRLGMVEQARPVYATLLRQNPNHREGLNNFLVLVSNESPQDALPELQRLEDRNPDFSPIPAQIAIVYDKLGYPDQARESMMRAIDLAPENLTYKYNLAIMLDHQKHYADAVALYRLLIQAAMNGEQVPAPIESLEKRVNYIVTATAEGRLGS